MTTRLFKVRVEVELVVAATGENEAARWALHNPREWIDEIDNAEVGAVELEHPGVWATSLPWNDESDKRVDAWFTEVK